MSDTSFKSVWDAIEDDPAQAAKMKHRSALMMAISEHIKAKGLNQTEAARLFAGARLDCSRSILWWRCLRRLESRLTSG